MAQVGFEPTTFGLLVRCSTNCTTDFFNYKRGVRQGCLLSSLLFSLYINDLEQCLANEGAEGVELWDIRLCAMLYADDLVLLAETEQDLNLKTAD